MENVERVSIPFPYVARQPVTNRTASIGPSDFRHFELQWGCGTTNECYNEQFLSIKPGCYNEHRYYNERGGILSADVARA